MIKEIDLHGIKHHQVIDMVENFVLTNEPPLRIITGQSIKMKEIVIRVLEEHKFNYAIPFFNQGVVMIL